MHIINNVQGIPVFDKALPPFPEMKLLLNKQEQLGIVSQFIIQLHKCE